MFILVASIFTISLVLADNTNSKANNEDEFCGTSTKGACQIDSDCVKGGCSNQVCENQTESSVTTCEYLDCYGAERYNKKCGCEENECKWSSNEKEEKGWKRANLTKEQIKEIIQEKNRIKFEERTGQECTEGCKCTGVVIKCELEDGIRQMTVYARSGNIIIVTKSVNASTTVELYKSNKTLIGVFKNNETKQIKMTPEQVQEKIKEKLKAKIEKMNITLQDDGLYHIEIGKKARLFFLFPVREKAQAQVDVEDGTIVKIRNPWWGFLAKDEKQQLLLGAGCGTVTPGMNNECCQNKGYDFYDSDKVECVFSE